MASDELEERLFKESYRCRVFRIKDIIRAVGKSLESESYRVVEDYYDAEISRVERNTASAKQRLDELEEKHRAEAFGRNRDIEKRIRTEEKELISNIGAAEHRLGDLEKSNRRAALERHQGKEEEIEKGYSGLEGRYFVKDGEIERSMRDYLSAQNIGIPIKRNIEQEKRIVNRYREEKEQINSRVERGEDELDEQITEEFRSKSKFEELKFF